MGCLGSKEAKPAAKQPAKSTPATTSQPAEKAAPSGKKREIEGSADAGAIRDHYILGDELGPL